MANSPLTLSMRLFLETRGFASGLQQSGREVERFTARSKNELEQLRDAARGVRDRLAAIGITVGITATAVQSARLDKSLTQIGLTAGVGQDEVRGLRSELFRLAQETGQPVQELQQGFNNLIASGLNWREALRVIEATNKAMAVSNAQADALTGGLTVAASAFQFDLSQPQMAVNLLDQMIVAGRQGNAELENLSSIFARVGVNAKAAGLGFRDTLAFIEGLSMVERQPERLATLADSTLRLFTNARYRKAAQDATGVKFFDAGGAARDPLKVLQDLRTKFQTLQTDQQRASFINRAFGNTDLDTQRGLRTLLSGDALEKVGRFSREIGGAAGTLDRDLERATNNAVDQVGRLKAALGEAADFFARGLTGAVNWSIKAVLDSREKGGLGLSGMQLAGGAAGLAAVLYGLRRFGGPLGRALGSAGGVAAGVAAGKALEEAAGVTPVFVTNWPGGMGGGAGDALGGALGGAALARSARVFGGWRAAAAIIAGTPLRNLATLGAGGIAGAAGMVGAAGVAGYGVGTAIYKAIDETSVADKIGSAIARTLAIFGNDTAAEAVKRRDQFDAGGTLKIEVNDKRTRITEMRANSPGMDFELSTGQMWALP